MEGVLPTGSLRLDIALGGGAPAGAIAEFFGPEAAGKTTLCLHTLAEAQKQGGVCALIDTEHSLDSRYARRCGVDIDRLYVAEPESAEQALDTCLTLAQSGALAVIVIDSASSLTPQAEIDRPLDGEGRFAEGRRPVDRLLSQALQKLSACLAQTGTAVIFTNRTGPRYGPVYRRLRENPFRLALKMRAALRLELKPLRDLTEKGEIQGICTQIRVVKHKIYPSSRPIVLDIMYNQGIAKAGEILDLGTQLLIITRQDSVYSYQGLRLGKESQEAVLYLRQNPGVCEEIEQAIRLRMLPPRRAAKEP